MMSGNAYVGLGVCVGFGVFVGLGGDVGVAGGGSVAVGGSVTTGGSVSTGSSVGVLHWQTSELYPTLPHSSGSNAGSQAAGAGSVD